MSFEKFRLLYALESYCKQIGIIIDIKDFIKNNEELATKILYLFDYRFNPKPQINKESPKISGLSPKYQNTFLILENLISKAIVRTNYYLSKTFISFKINLSLFDQNLATLPKPLTFREIFVFGDEFEAIHLRNGKIARGGLRWSDRDDFRTEVLSLVKTQNTKNTIIVPVGSKGGFRVKKQPESLSKQEIFEHGKECYRKFLEGCLDITDNVIHGEIKTPKSVIIYDDKDPYLAVAADKGTATFSDLANQISKEYHFWLGDAFASGGSNGYDHKKMAITSKGAWISTQRHFREMGVNVEIDEFTVVGIGDMSGDVFGNGMLRSKKIKLICAFNHMNIFIDPNPNPEVSFKERERLFYLPTSTWEDYNLNTASKGAKIFKRSDKFCTLTPEIKRLFNITEDSLKPEDLIRVILKSKFDLLWNGGIGTYIKASFESDADAGDKINDILRIDGNELGAKVVTEGGNLGLTQLGRVEYALSGGRINTDAIDNSAGVDCSDHEVNIKILLNALVHSGRITLEKRNEIIKKMRSNVTDLVLEDNYNQSLVLSLETKNKNIAEYYSEFVEHLKHTTSLDMETEKLPNLTDVQNRGLTRPEFAILLAYTKMESYDKLFEGNIWNEQYTEKFLINYFPNEMKETLLHEVKTHQLKEELICSVMSNRFVNFGGITLGFEAQKATAKPLVEVIKAYFVAEKILHLEKIFEDIKNSDYKINSEKQYETILTIREQLLKPMIIKILKSETEIHDIEKTAEKLESSIKIHNNNDKYI